MATALGVQAFLSRARRSGRPEDELAARRRLQPALLAEHVALAVLLASGFVLLRHHGWGLGHARWIALKVGLVAFLVVPLETIHVKGAAPPVACSCCEYAKSLNAAGKEAVVIIKGDTTVIEKVRRTA